MKRSALAAALFLAGCTSFSGDIAEHATDYNRTIEQVENRMLLLNVVRASKSYPLHFTRISQIQGNLQGGGSAALTVPFANGADGPLTGVLATSASSNPGFVIQILDDKEFFNGILTPIDEDRLATYLAAGWPVSRLFRTFVESARVGLPGSGACTIVSDPDADDGDGVYHRRAFNALIDYVDAIGPSRRSVTEMKPFGPRLATGAIADPKTLVEIREAGLDIEMDAETGTAQLGDRERQHTLSLSTADDEGRKAAAIPVRECTLAQVAELERLARTRTAAATIAVNTRSPQGAVYALGELMRYAAEYRAAGGEAPEDCGRRFEDDLPGRANCYAGIAFVVREGVPGDAAVAVEHKGRSYWIPREGTEAMSHLALVRQILSLQISADTAPVPSTILLR